MSKSIKIAGVILASLLVLTGCGEAANQDTGAKKAGKSPAATPTPTYDALRATPGEKWEHFEEAARQARIREQYWASTESDAADTADVLCANSADKMQNNVDFSRAFYKGAEYEGDTESTLLFLDAYCPEKRALYQQALDTDQAGRLVHELV